MRPISKSYRLLNFLNRRHSAPVKGTVSGASWALAAVSSNSFTLANHVRSKIAADDFKTGLRQLHWITRRSPFRLSLLNDRFFDPTDGMELTELQAFHRYLDRIGGKRSPFDDATDRLYALAREAHLHLTQGDQAKFEQTLQTYRRCFREAEELLKDIKPAPRQGKPKHGENENVFSKSDARHALSDFAALAAQNGSPWYVISGTFLGLIREGGWLDHDYDVDIGVHAEEFDLQQMKTALQECPAFEIRKIDNQIRIARQGDRYVIENLPTMIKVIHKSGINIDLFVHYLEDGVRWHGSILHRWDNHDFELVDYELDGVAVKGPKNADQYLTENYGDWKTPVTEFNCTTGTPNLAIVSNLFSPALFLKRVGALYEEGNYEQAEKLKKSLSGHPLIEG